MKGREPGVTAPGDGDGLGDAFGSRVEGAASELEGTPLGLEAVVPTGIGELPGEIELPGPGGVAGTAVGLGVGLGVGRAVGLGVGGGVAVGAGVGDVTTTGPTETGVGFAPLLLTALKVTVQLPAGSVVDPVQIWLASEPPVTASEIDRPATEAVTLVAGAPPP